MVCRILKSNSYIYIYIGLNWSFINILVTKIYNNAQLFFEAFTLTSRFSTSWSRSGLSLTGIKKKIAISSHFAKSISLDRRSSIICWNSCREKHLSNSCLDDGEDDSWCTLQKSDLIFQCSGKNKLHGILIFVNTLKWQLKSDADRAANAYLERLEHPKQQAL